MAKRCFILISDAPECKYGNKGLYCENILAYECYGRRIEIQCCETCPGFIQNNQPGVYRYLLTH